MLLSIVIPLYNEEESLDKLIEEIHETAEAEKYDLDVVFIDDGSSDESWSIVERLSKEHDHIRGIRFRRNFGKAAGLDAGFLAAKGDFVMTMDADLQDDPHEIPEFLAQLEEENLDVISGWKKKRHDPWHKVLPSRVFNYMVSRLTGVWLHDHNCGMKCYRGEVVKEIRLYGELHRFVPVLAAARGFKIGEKVVQHRSREFGVSKYGVERFVKGFLDLLTVKFMTGYGKRPQHFLGTVGLTSFFVGGLWMSILAFIWLLSRILNSFGQWPFEGVYDLGGKPGVIYAAALLLLGAQLISTGVVAELLVANNPDHACDYAISEETSVESTKESTN